MMRKVIFAAMLLGLMGSTYSAKADEMDKDNKTKTAPAVTNVAKGGSELDRESPDQSHGWRWRRGWYGGWGVGFGPTFGYSSFYGPTYTSWYGGGWGGGWSGGWGVSYYRPVHVGWGWSHGCW